MPDAQEAITQAAAAQRLGLTAQAVGVWASKPGAPVRQRAGKRLLLWPDFPRWRETQLLQARSDAPAVAKSKARKLAAEARMAEIDLQEREGQLVPIEDTRRVVAALLTKLRNQIVPFPQRMAPQVVGLKTVTDAERVLSTGIHSLLVTLSGDLPDGDEVEA